MREWYKHATNIFFLFFIFFLIACTPQQVPIQSFNSQNITYISSSSGGVSGDAINNFANDTRVVVQDDGVINLSSANASALYFDGGNWSFNGLTVVDIGTLYATASVIGGLYTSSNELSSIGVPIRVSSDGGFKMYQGAGTSWNTTPTGVQADGTSSVVDIAVNAVGADNDAAFRLMEDDATVGGLCSNDALNTIVFPWSTFTTCPDAGVFMVKSTDWQWGRYQTGQVIMNASADAGAPSARSGDRFHLTLGLAIETNMTKLSNGVEGQVVYINCVSDAINFLNGTGATGAFKFTDSSLIHCNPGKVYPFINMDDGLWYPLSTLEGNQSPIELGVFANSTAYLGVNNSAYWFNEESNNATINKLVSDSNISTFTNNSLYLCQDALCLSNCNANFVNGILVSCT